MKTEIIGVDFSTDPSKTGLARAAVDGSKSGAVVHEVCKATSCHSPVEIVADWIREGCRRKTCVLIAIDAPLGWPHAMKEHCFTSHKAGHALEISADRLFSRETDRQVRKRIGRKPLEVGANLIARSALGALNFLQELNSRLNGRDSPPLPLAWSPRDLKRGPCVVEVYPAATMIQHGIRIDSCDKYKQYKRSGENGKKARNAVIAELQQGGLWFKAGTEDIAKNDHMVDATVCVLAGLDFLTKRAVGPDFDSHALAKLEGWIWAR